MFEAAVVKLVESVSELSLEPVPDLYSAEWCKPWKIGVKKEKKFFWNSAKFIPTQFSLSDILVTPNEVLAETTISSPFLTSYAQTHKLALDGKLGAKLKDVLDIDVSGRDYIYLHANLGSITKVELNLVELNKKVESGLLVDLKNEFVKQISRGRRNTFYIVNSCLVLAKTCFITGATEVEVHEHITGNVKVPVVKINVVNVDESVNLDNRWDKYIHIPAGTPLAFDFTPLAITESGHLSLIFDSCKQAGFNISDTVDGIAYVSSSTDDLPDKALQCNVAQLRELRDQVLLLCQDPQGLHILSHMLNKAVDSIDIGVLGLVEPVGKHGQHFVGNVRAAWTSIIIAAGFTLQDDKLTAPTVSSAGLQSLAVLFDQLDYLGCRAVLALAQLDGDSVQPACVLLDKVIISFSKGEELAGGTPIDLPLKGQQLVEALGVLQPDMLQRWERATAALRVLRALW